MGRGLRAVGLAGRAFLIQEQRVLDAVVRAGFHVVFPTRALLAGGRGVDREPDRALFLRGVIGVVHRAEHLVMLLHEGAIRIEPFENDDLPGIVGEGVSVPVEIDQGEIRRLLADFGDGHRCGLRLCLGLHPGAGSRSGLGFDFYLGLRPGGRGFVLGLGRDRQHARGDQPEGKSRDSAQCSGIHETDLL